MHLFTARRPSIGRFVVPATIMLSFVSFWRASAIVLAASTVQSPESQERTSRDVWDGASDDEPLRVEILAKDTKPTRFTLQN